MHETAPALIILASFALLWYTAKQCDESPTYRQYWAEILDMDAED